MSETPSEPTRTGLDKAEAGDKAGATLVEQAERTKPEDAEAVEQARSDGPEGRGVER